MIVPNWLVLYAEKQQCNLQEIEGEIPKFLKIYMQSIKHITAP
jgi:hypothetical protein